MVVEFMYSIGIVSSIALCLLDVFFLGAEEVMLLGCLSLGHCTSILACYFEVLLPAVKFEESLTRTILSPDPVLRMNLFRANIPSTLLLIHPSMLLLAMFPHQT